MRLGWWMLSSVALAFSAAAVRGEVSSASITHQGWQDLSLLNSQAAQDAFLAATAANPAGREARLGHALAFLQSRSRTPANITAATDLFAALQTENADDDAGIAATYYLARIQQLHSFTPNRPAAVAGLRALLRAHPQHHYAQLAAPKLAVLLLYDDVPPDEWERRVEEVHALIPQLKAPEAARDTRLVLATALIRLRHDHVRAYPLFASCLASGSVTRMPRRNSVLVQAAESAEKLGKKSEAAAYYAGFLVDFPHDQKSDEIRRRLTELKREAAP